MSGKSQVLCKYHMSGVCRFGADCAFSHDLGALPNQVCKFYLAGCCAYGNRCRYDHKRPDWWKAKTGQSHGQGNRPEQQQQQPSGGTVRVAPDPSDTPGPSDSSTVRPPPRANGPQPTERPAAGPEADLGEGGSTNPNAPGYPGGGVRSLPSDADVAASASASAQGQGQGSQGQGLVMVDDDVGLLAERAVARRGRAVPGDPLFGVCGAQASRWAADSHPWEGGEGGEAGTSSRGGRGGGGDASTSAGASRQQLEPVDPADVELCRHFALHGRCGEGDECLLIHGLECEICHKFRIHPYNADEAAEHVATCRLWHDHLDARLRSAAIECGICLEPVLSKPSVSERRFGLLACDHAFCLICIRSWRERNTDTSLATDTAVRTCPVCRTPTHFVTPSLVWPATPDEKEGIMQAYKSKLSSIDCRHFNFGDGTCPFSTSCFYRHSYRDGRMEEPSLRRAGNADGDVKVLGPVSLSAFFDTPQAQRLLQSRRR